MEVGRMFFDVAIPVLATLMGFIWKSASQKVEQLESRIARVEEDKCRIEVKVARIDATLESWRD